MAARKGHHASKTLRRTAKTAPQLDQRGPKVKTYLQPPALVTVRCLGPAKYEHTFESEGPHNRICEMCRAMIRDRVRALSPRAFEPAADAPVSID